MSVRAKIGIMANTTQPLVAKARATSATAGEGNPDKNGPAFAEHFGHQARKSICTTV